MKWNSESSHLKNKQKKCTNKKGDIQVQFGLRMCGFEVNNPAMKISLDKIS